MTDIASPAGAADGIPRPPAAEGPARPPAPRRPWVLRYDLAARVAFWFAVALFVVTSANLVRATVTPAGWDSQNNLTDARNIATGRGFVTDIVQELVEPEPLPGPETVRAPGLPYILAGIYKVAGVRPRAHIVVNVIVVLLSALLLRAVLRAAGAGWLGDVGGLLVLASHQNYELVQFGNNGTIVAVTCVYLLIAVRNEQGRWGGWRLAVGLGLLAGVSFLLKQTTVLSSMPFAFLLLATDAREPMRHRLRDCLVAGSVALAVVAPYLVRNILLFHHLMYAPINTLRLPVRYYLYGWEEFYRIVRFGEPAYTYGRLLRELGPVNYLTAEGRQFLELVDKVLRLGVGPVVWAAGGLVFFFRRRDWRLYALTATLLVAPVFDVLYWVVEPRYLWPVFPCLVFLGWLACRAYAEWAESAMSEALRRRVRLAFALVLLYAVAQPVIPTIKAWRADFRLTRTPTPGWVALVRALPADAVVMCNLPPWVSWQGEHRAVITPLGPPRNDRADLLAVLRLYHPRYLLELGALEPRERPFAPGDLALEGEGADWKLYRILLQP